MSSVASAMIRRDDNQAVAADDSTVVRETLPAAAKKLRMGSFEETLLVVPKSYRDFATVDDQAPAAPGPERLFCLCLARRTGLNAAKLPTKNWKETVRVDMVFEDAAGAQVSVMVVGAVWPWLKQREGNWIYLYGQPGTDFRGGVRMTNPQIVDASDIGKIVPVYPGKVGQVSGESVAQMIALAWARPGMKERAAMRVAAQAGLSPPGFARLTGYGDPEDLLADLHVPSSVGAGQRAAAAARKLSVHTLIHGARNATRLEAVEGSSIAVDRDVVARLVRSLPFPLTQDQQTAIEAIVRGLRSPYPLRAVLSGDVGTGKSLVFMVPAVAAFRAGARVAIMAPTTLLAAQLAREIRQFFAGVPVFELGADGAGGRQRDIPEGAIVVGTVALAYEARRTRRTWDFVITDEQHKYSRDQREVLTRAHTNLIESSATPIPRTMALVRYGTFQTLELRQSPVSKQISTRITALAARRSVMDEISQIIGAGGQVAVIYPLVDQRPADPEDDRDAADASAVAGGVGQVPLIATAQVQAGVTRGSSLNPSSPTRSVVEAAQKWEKRLPGRVGVLHGGMTSDEQKAVIDRMMRREIDLLVCTTVVETGVTLPSLRGLVVVDAERYGLSQLHQLRGRLARHGGDGLCLLLPGASASADAMARLQVLERCNDGFDVAEQDLHLRGFGDLSGDEQTGGIRTLFFGVNIEPGDVAEMAAGATP